MDSRVEAAEPPARVPWILSPPVIQSRDPFLPPDPPKELSPTPGPKAQRHRLAEHAPLLLQKSLTERAQKTHLEGQNHPGGKTCLLMTSFQSPVGAPAPRQPEEEPREVTRTVEYKLQGTDFTLSTRPWGVGSSHSAEEEGGLGPSVSSLRVAPSHTLPLSIRNPLADFHEASSWKAGPRYGAGEYWGLEKMSPGQASFGEVLAAEQGQAWRQRLVCK
ncbi:hypothetical protein MG293_020080 [Ovis ammon polii]|uniref:Uncharacterized protein n=1 Tax=Ovis ammon polii TaxID=230172 RepID=A0AAD4TQ55_OVIAM|nr:hypothetical protein MG293_020080 [Ovis ammon polii]